MREDILDMMYVMENGTEYDELESELFTDRMLVPETGEGFTGLLYEQVDETEIYWYGYYKNGYSHGIQVDFWEKDKIWKIGFFRCGLGDGKCMEWDKDENLVKEREHKVGILLTYKIYDKDGNVIEEQTEPSDFELGIIKQREKMVERTEQSWKETDVNQKKG